MYDRNKQTIIEALRFAPAEFTPAERDVIAFQLRTGQCSSFDEALFRAIFLADKDNRQRLATIFPDQVEAAQAWSEGRILRKASDIIACLETSSDREEVPTF